MTENWKIIFRSWLSTANDSRGNLTLFVTQLIDRLAYQLHKISIKLSQDSHRVGSWIDSFSKTLNPNMGNVDHQTFAKKFLKYLTLFWKIILSRFWELLLFLKKLWCSRLFKFPSLFSSFWNGFTWKFSLYVSFF